AYDIEMTKALERHRNGEATLIPIIARACAWHLTPLSELQAPVDGQPLGNLTPLQRDPLYSGIIDAVAKAAQQKRAEKEQTRRYFNDKKAWEKAVQLNTLKSYDNYLLQHPNGQHRSQAESAIAGIKAKQKAEREKIERQAWETAKEQQDYETYLKNYPNGQYAAAAQSAIVARDKEQAQAAKTADKRAFQSAKAQNSIAAYQQYLEDFPQGSYRKAAWKEIEHLENSEDRMVFSWRRIVLAIGAFLFLCFAIWISDLFTTISKNPADYEISSVEIKGDHEVLKVYDTVRMIFDESSEEFIFIVSGEEVYNVEDLELRYWTHEIDDNVKLYKVENGEWGYRGEDLTTANNNLKIWKYSFFHAPQYLVNGVKFTVGIFKHDPNPKDQPITTISFDVRFKG
ncbi:MAG: hypothetical protein AAF849_24515, partial [Bacteroidota bacterium]